MSYSSSTDKPNEFSDDESPSRQNGGGNLSRNSWNKNKNTRGKQLKQNGKMSMEHTPSTLALENQEQPQLTKSDQNSGIDIPLISTPESRNDSSWDNTSDEPFVTANNSSDEIEMHNGNSDDSFNSFHVKEAEEDVVNSNTPTSTETMTPNNSVIYDDGKGIQEVSPNSTHEDEQSEDEDEVANASLAVQLSDTAYENLSSHSFTGPSVESSMLSSPLSSSRSAPPDLPSIQDQDAPLQNTDSIIYPYRNEFQTSTPISSNPNVRRGDESEGNSINVTSRGGEISRGWDSTIYSEDPTHIARANTGFLVNDVDDSAQQSNLGFTTTKESGICDMSTTPGNNDSLLEVHEENKAAVAVEVTSVNSTVEELVVSVPTGEDDTECHVEVPNPILPKSVTFQDPLPQNANTSAEASDGDEEVEEINKPFLLPTTVTELMADNGVKVYIVGTAHFSRQSQLDVIETIQKVQPTGVLLELCHSRSGMFAMNEEQIMKEAADMNIQKIRSTIRESGPVQGCLHLLLLSMTASLTKKLGMAPGGEFRVALQEARKIQGCAVHLGDRNLSITLNRALSGLGLFQKLKLTWYFLTSNDGDITKEKVEAYKEKDLLEKLLLEMAGEFPGMARVLLDERDLFLAHSLWLAATSLRMDRFGFTGPNEGPIVGVVGMGHVAGIVKNWGKVSEDMIAEIMEIPEPTLSSVIFRKTVKFSFYALIGFGVWKCSRKVFNFPSNKLIESALGQASSTLQKITPQRLTGR